MPRLDRRRRPSYPMRGWSGDDAGRGGRAGSGQGRIAVATMYFAKGLEFGAVAVMACDEAVIPASKRIADVSDEMELDEVYATERQLLYVAATRARDRLMLSGVGPGSEFLADMQTQDRAISSRK
jgi:superfamily I DNA/RNA helicase